MTLPFLLFLQSKPNANQKLPLRFISLKLAVFFTTMWKPCQTNSLESGFHMVAKKTASLSGIDFKNLILSD